MDLLAYLEKLRFLLFFFFLCNSSKILCLIESLHLFQANLHKKQDQLTTTQDFNTNDRSFILPKAFIITFIFFPTNNFFKQFMKVFLENTLAKTRLQEYLLNTRSSENYLRKSYIKCYDFF